MINPKSGKTPESHKLEHFFSVTHPKEKFNESDKKWSKMQNTHEKKGVQEIVLCFPIRAVEESVSPCVGFGLDNRDAGKRESKRS